MVLSHQIITGIILLLGIATVLLSGYACRKFNIFRTGLKGKAAKLTNAVAWQLGGEAIIGLGTLVFALAEFLGYLSSWSYYLTSFLRFTMFIATSLTTLHLVFVLSILHKDPEA